MYVKIHAYISNATNLNIIVAVPLLLSSTEYLNILSSCFRMLWYKLKAIKFCNIHIPETYYSLTTFIYLHEICILYKSFFMLMCTHNVIYIYI